MATVDKVFPDYNRKLQLDQFEPVQHGVELEVSLEEGDDPEEVYYEYADRAEDMVERELAERIAQKKLEEAEDDDE